jgi:transcriptional regulator with XRE-family HTH domain
MPRNVQVEGPHPVDRFVGEQVRKRREELGLNQSDLARQIGLTFQQVQKYEKAANRISSSKLFQIAEVLKAPIEWFYPKGGETVETPPARDVEVQAMTRLRRFLSTFPASDSFLLTTAAQGPMLTIALLHTQGRTRDELEAQLDAMGDAAEASA